MIAPGGRGRVSAGTPGRGLSANSQANQNLSLRAELNRCAPARPPRQISPMNEKTGGVRLVRVPDDRDGQRLDNFLLGQLKGAPRSIIYKIVRSGQVRVNGGRAKPETKLSAGAEVRIPPVRLAEEGELKVPPKGLQDRLGASVVFEDKSVL
ncbi:MAG TPA: 23S rRNA pseudouridine(955/2504/2580) synthase, partial [Xanthomonadaceae bacterium]|nr:23S rRNA pseudouridine(955/2504/2580) synthase [Xanthomonadaceae bacterium]